MMIRTMIVSLICAFAAPATMTEETASPRETLIATERAFAATSVSQGVRAAFLEYLDEDAVLFRPGPVPGHDYMEKQIEPPIVLEWEPTLADVSSAGDLGYTSGPWKMSTKDGKAEPAFGQFVSIWRVRPDGVWRVILDHGTIHPTQGEHSETVRLPPHAPPPTGSVNLAEASRKLLDAEESLSSRIKNDGMKSAYAGAMSPEAMIYRDGMLPLSGEDSIATAADLQEHASLVEHNPEAAVVSASGDLGYTYGTWGFQRGEIRRTWNFVRIWRPDREGTWKVVLDLSTVQPEPLPAPSGS